MTDDCVNDSKEKKHIVERNIDENCGENGREVHKINNAEGKLICIWKHEKKNEWNKNTHKNKQTKGKKIDPWTLKWIEEKKTGCFHLCCRKYRSNVCYLFNDGQYVGVDIVLCEYKYSNPIEFMKLKLFYSGKKKFQMNKPSEYDILRKFHVHESVSDEPALFQFDIQQPTLYLNTTTTTKNELQIQVFCILGRLAEKKNKYTKINYTNNEETNRFVFNLVISLHSKPHTVKIDKSYVFVHSDRWNY